VRKPERPPAGEAVRVLLSDGTGDTMLGVLHRVPGSTRPLVVLLHGLTGSADSTYMWAATRYLTTRGVSVVRMNLRGAGSSSQTCSRYYHAGCVAEQRDVLRALRPHAPNGMLWVGHSLGGAILVNLLSDLPDDHGVVGAMTVSAPVDPVAASRRLQAARNRMYQRSLLMKMKEDVLGLVTALSNQERNAIAASDSIERFDDVFSGPFNGYASGADYYARTAAGPKLGGVEVPLLMVHAANDPWIPVAGYRALEPSLPGQVRIEITSGGGHVGFHDRLSKVPWQVRRLHAWVVALAGA
jgi:predicted alpha/beta-fold hydrolase